MCAGVERRHVQTVPVDVGVPRRMTSMKKPTCETCVYWRDFEYREVSLGGCRKNAPSPIMTEECLPEDRPATEIEWPTVHRLDWCGEYIDKVTFKTFLECMGGKR